MIFYFSGTGNSLYAAQTIARKQNEPLVSISAALASGQDQLEYNLMEQERIGFVFPIHAWGPPQMVLDFIGKLKLNGYKKNYVFAVATCGGNIGNTMKLMDACLKKNGLTLDGQFSIIMPNNYIIMGDVDTKTREQEKLIEAENVLKTINQQVAERMHGEFGLVKGFLPWMLTGVINPMFRKNAMSTSKFFVQDDRCSGCGICEKVCNCRTIQVNGKPEWGKACSQCLACVHYCPSKAIQYGKGTEKKGRYTHPQLTFKDMMQS